MPTVGTTSKPAYVYDAGSDTWIPIGPGEHSHSYIPNTLVDAKGDILTATAADTPAILAAGTNGQYLSANSSTATGLEWVAAPTAGSNWTLLNAGGTSLSGSLTTVSGISAKDKIMIFVNNASTNTDNQVLVRFNTDSGNNYYNYGVAWGRSNNYGLSQLPTGSVALTYVGLPSNNGYGYLLLTGANSSGVKIYQSLGGSTDNVNAASYAFGGYYNSASTISSISILCDNAATFDNGTVYVYTSA